MCGLSETVVLGERDSAGTPSATWVEETLKTTPLKMLVVVNPCNPTGTMVDEANLRRISDACQRHGCWLIVDNTYEYFTYADDAGADADTPAPRTTILSDPHVLNIFSFSKAYGMMGWRVGYIAYTDEQPSASPHDAWSLHAQIIKVQDTIPICPSRASQVVALHAAKAGRGWFNQHMPNVIANRNAVHEALVAALGPVAVQGGQGAIYLLVSLPVGDDGPVDDVAIVRALAQDHGVVVIPGSSCGAPGYIRVCYANLEPPQCAQAAERLRKGLLALFPNLD